jgi:hypothetical protein
MIEQQDCSMLDSADVILRRACRARWRPDEGQVHAAGWKNMHPEQHYFQEHVDLYEHIGDPTYLAKEETFASWYENPIDLPGRWYLQAINQLFKDNRLAKGQFVGLGRPLKLKDITCPLYLLAGAADDITTPEQVLDAAKYVGTPANKIVQKTVPGRHIGESERLMARLHDGFTGRVKRTNVEQRLIEFRIPKTFELSEDAASLPDETVLVEHGEAFSLFKVGAIDGMMSWGAFKSMLRDTSEASWRIIGSIERSAISAICRILREMMSSRVRFASCRSPRLDVVYRVSNSSDSGSKRA